MGYHSYPSPANKDVAHVKQNVQKDAFYPYKGMLCESVIQMLFVVSGFKTHIFCEP